MIAKQQLENAARAMGLTPHWTTQRENSPLFMQARVGGEQQPFNPHLPTTQGKADLLDLMLALKLDVRWSDSYLVVEVFATNRWCRSAIEISNGNKHAALAEAVVSVASRIWESKQ
jgi:hypothetical protein